MSRHAYPTGSYAGVSADSATALADALARLFEQTPWLRDNVQYNPMLRELGIQYDGRWHVVRVEAE